MDKKILDLVLAKITENVKLHRKNKGFSQLNLALAMGYKSVGLISFVEAGINNRRFNIEHLAAIAMILEVPVCCFFQGIDEILSAKSEI